MATLTRDLWNIATASARQTEVPSFTKKDTTYTVKDAFTPFYSCTCPDHMARGRQRPCKHVLFVRAAVEEMVGLSRSLREHIKEEAVLGDAAPPPVRAVS